MIQSREKNIVFPSSGNISQQGLVNLQTIIISLTIFQNIPEIFTLLRCHTIFLPELICRIIPHRLLHLIRRSLIIMEFQQRIQLCHLFTFAVRKFRHLIQGRNCLIIKNTSQKRGLELFEIQEIFFCALVPLRLDDGHGDYNRSYERNDDDFDYDFDDFDDDEEDASSKDVRIEKVKDDINVLIIRVPPASFRYRPVYIGTEIGDEDFARLASRIRTQAEVMKDAPTVFEIMTAMGMLYFAEKQCDIVFNRL